MMMMDGAALLPHDGDVCYLLPALMVPAGADYDVMCTTYRTTGTVFFAGADDDDGCCCYSAARRR